jgi:hypothetical protein
MKKLIPDSIKSRKPFEPGMGGYKDFGIEFFKGRPTKFWDGVLTGLILGYIPYLWHMYI